MQHRYVPDLGDFSKFAVIDALSAKGQDRTALIWYLVNPHEVGDHHNNDGRHTGYLDDDRQGFALCHPELYQRFQAIHRTGEKHIGVYARHNVLPNIGYFPEPMSYKDRALTEREQWRAGWLSRALVAAADANIVVLDPDNGLMAGRHPIRSRLAVKYATLDECKAFYANSHRSLVVYQHAHRQGTAQQQAAASLRRLTDHLEADVESAFALRFHRGTTRFYLVIPAKHQENTMRARAEELVDSEWGRRGALFTD